MPRNVANLAGSTAFAIAPLVSSALRIFSDLPLILAAVVPRAVGIVLLDPFRLPIELGLVLNTRALLVPPDDVIEPEEISLP